MIASRCALILLAVWLASLAAALASVSPDGTATSTMLAQSPGDRRAGKPSEAIPDGVYVLKFAGKGHDVRLTDGSRAVLGRRLTESIGTEASLRSVSNDNTALVFRVWQLGPLPPECRGEHLALVVDGVCLYLGGTTVTVGDRHMHIRRLPKPSPDGMVDTWAHVHSIEAAGTLANRYGIKIQWRKHPGHRFEVRWVPIKTEFTVGEVVTLRLELRNTGKVPIRFTFGGQQRGKRNNQFRFLAYGAYGSGKAVPDIGNPTPFGIGGMTMTSETILPRQMFTTEVNLDGWFRFTAPDTYRITGILELPMRDPRANDRFGPVIWDELVVGDCWVRIVRKNPWTGNERKRP
jgi:hypothetical protein